MAFKIVTVYIMDFAENAEIYIDYNRNIQKQEIKFPNCFEKPQRCSDFIKSIISLIPVTQIKAMVFVINCKYQLLTAQKVVKERFRGFCEQNEIFFHFPSEEIVMLNGGLFNLKPNVKENECIAFMVCGLTVSCRIVKRVGKFYTLVDSCEFTIPEVSNAKHTISLKHKLKHVIFINYSTDGKYFKDFGLVDSIDKIQNAFSGVAVSFLGKSIHDAGVDAIPGMIRYLMDGKESEYMTRYFCDTEFTLSSLIKCKKGDPLPFDKTVIYDVKNGYLMLCETKSGCIKRIDLNKYNCSNIKITFELDIDMFYELQIEPIGPPLQRQEPIENIFKGKLNLQSKDKAKLVFTQNYFSIFVFKKGKKKVIKNADGLTQFPLYISFVEEVPVIGETAKRLLKDQPTFVIYDLMKLCSSNVLLNKDSKWPFKITSNSKNEVLIEFDTFRGRRKTAPDFFIGMILKFCMGLVEKESGMKFEELGIEFDGIGNNENFMECFEKAAKRVNLKLAFL